MKGYPRFRAEDALDIEVGSLCRRVRSAEDRFNPHCHEYYEIFITVSGKVKHWVNGNVYNLPEGSLVFIRPDDIHGYIYDGEETEKVEYVNFCFTKETAKELFTYLSDSFPSKKLEESPLPPTVVVRGEEKNQILSLVTQLYSVNYDDKDMLKIRSRVILAEIFTRFSRNDFYEENEKLPLWLNILLRNMELPENFTRGAERMVFLSNKSKEHISRTIKKYFGITPSDYVNNLRINYAGNLLMNTDTPVIDICYECGFQNLSHFYRNFKKRHGVSPGDFRRQFGK